MAGSATRLRSVLYMPASNARALDKARTLPCDGVIVDLEDAVAPDAKEAARSAAVEAVRTGGFGHRVVTVRCNGLATPWGADDMRAIGSSGVDAVVVPKVTSPSDVDDYVEALDQAGGDGVAVWPMIETPGAVLDAPEIARHPRVTVVVLGTNDLVLELRASAVPGRAPLVPHLARVVLAARAAGIGVLDGVHNDIADHEGFRAECLQAVALGFDGKTLIHPSQIEPCNVAWTPTSEEIEHAHRVIAAFDQAVADGRGVATVDGRMIEHLHVEQARRVLELGGRSEPD